MQKLADYSQPVSVQFASIWQAKHQDLLKGDLSEKLTSAKPEVQQAIANYVKYLREALAARAEAGLPEHSHGSRHPVGV